MSESKKTYYYTFEVLSELKNDTDQIDKVVEYLRSKGKKVLYTCEPGNPHLEISKELNNMMKINLKIKY